MLAPGRALTMVLLFSATRLDAVEVLVPHLGTLRGRLSVLSPEVAVFSGIPYAKPPVGDLRWRPSQPYGAWSSPRDATASRAACPATAPQKYPNVTESEDCLFLSVASPLKRAGSGLLPVLVFIQ